MKGNLSLSLEKSNAPWYLRKPAYIKLRSQYGALLRKVRRKILVHEPETY